MFYSKNKAIIKKERKANMRNHSPDHEDRHIDQINSTYPNSHLIVASNGYLEK